MADLYKVAKNWMTIWIRTGPGVNYPTKGIIAGKDNIEYKSTELSNKYWVHLYNNANGNEIGWACTIDSNGMVVLNKTGTAAEPVELEEEMVELEEESTGWIPEYGILTSSQEELNNSIENYLRISNMRGIFGMPYQFMASVDPRLSNDGDALGRKYAKELVTNMPLLLMTAGKPVFMSKYSDSDKKTILENFIKSISGDDEYNNISNTVLHEDFGKYYSLDYAWAEYFQYVNPMCRIAARLMRLHDVKVDGFGIFDTDLDKYNWADNINEKFSKLFSVYRGCTAWYCEADTSISESFSNNTTESALAAKVNGLSDMGRELQFLLGTVKSETGVQFDKFTSEDNLAENMDNVNQFIEGVLGKGGVSNIFKSISNSAQTVVAGGKLVFPEIWSGSGFSRDYNITLKFVSPDADDLSIYLNIIVPMLHLLGLVLPRESSKSHGYISPFLVRAYYKGLFNVDMGIITDLSFSKGKEGAWTKNGLPTVVEASFTIKDLYSDMYMTSMNQAKHNMLNNIILMDYIGNLVGVNINEVDVYRGIDLYFTQNIRNRVSDTWHLKIWGSLDQYVSNKWKNLFGKF